MDEIVADVFSKWYVYLYTNFNHKINYYAPPPDQLFGLIRQFITLVDAYSPPIVRTYYNILNSSILPAIINTVCHGENGCSVNSETIKTVAVVIALLVLYAIFAIVMSVMRGITRLALGLVRLGALTSMLVLLACIVVSIVSATTLKANTGNMYGGFS